MKKHILGLAIFSFIFVSFAFAYAFLCAPSLPKVEEVKTPVYVSEKRSSCRKSFNEISYEVVSSQLDLKEKKLTTLILLKWNGSGSAPTNVYVNTEILAPIEKRFEYDSANIRTSFDSRNRAEILIESDVSDQFPVGKKDNVYAKFSVSDQYVEAKRDGNYSKMFPVVVAHDANATKVIKGQLVVR